MTPASTSARTNIFQQWSQNDQREKSAAKRLKTNSLQGINSEFVHKVSDLQFGQAKLPSSALTISVKGLEEIYRYVQLNYAYQFQQASRDSASIYLRPEQTGLERAIHFSKDGRVFLHMNRYTKVDSIFRQTSTFNECEVFDLFTGHSLVSRGYKSPAKTGELEGYDHLKGVFGFIQVVDKVSYPYHLDQLKTFLPAPEIQRIVEENSSPAKDRIIFGKTNEDNLYKMLFGDPLSGYKDPNVHALTERESKELYIGLVERVGYLHSQNLLHRNLNALNIRLHRMEDETVVPIIDGLESVCRVDDREKRSNQVSTMDILTPEVAAILFIGMEMENSQFDNQETQLEDQISEATTPASDVWALGCLLYQILLKEPMPWNLEYSDERKMIPGIIIYSQLKNEWFIEPEEQNSPLHLVWEMLEADPAKRPTIETIKSKLNELIWTHPFPSAPRRTLSI